ncbi:cytochrome P450 [Nocardioides sp. TRM66260-LWL]|uniref:cytochrome P450 n=1 Tax=Nocardioides sp. TRM66260-LWL TaxID=2874478 RepID=UPI001CC7B5F8|nr:cytochrome P450 [Nocardioides sp. TRM66260-LWL]MBZ5736133.1 cytochrome P450 [Nocardioides sp. TRM66260-LWL]
MIASPQAVVPHAQALTRWTLGHAIPSVAIAARARQGDLQGEVIRRTSRSQDLPLDLFERIREAGPFYRGRLAHVTARHGVVREALANPAVHAGIGLDGEGPLARLASWARQSQPLGPITPPSLLATEPPDHTRMRKLVTRVFTVRAVESLRARTEEVAQTLLDDLEARAAADPRGEVDLVDAYAALLPVTVICEILGVPLEERDEVRRFGTLAAPSLDLGLSLGRFREVESALAEFDLWLRAHVERVRRHPGDDLLSQLVAVREDDGGRLSDAELISTAGLVLAAGFETTVNLIGNGTALLAQHPEQRRRLLAGESSWANAVDEALRFDPPVLLTGRTVVADTEIAGTAMRRGELVITHLAGANRDPDVFADPHVFDVDRANAGEHVAFSSGRHYCLGAALARMEGEVALRALHERLPGLRVDVDRARRRDTRILRGWAELPVSPGA